MTTMIFEPAGCLCQIDLLSNTVIKRCKVHTSSTITEIYNYTKSKDIGENTDWKTEKDKTK